MVRYLFQFINNRRLCPVGAYKVNIEAEINKYKAKNPNIKPKIVFDFGGCITIFIYGNEILSGGRLTLTGKRIESFLQKLKSFDVDLIFFVDGQIKEMKIPTWLQRVNLKYEMQCEIFEKIRQGEETEIVYSGQSLFCAWEIFLRVARKYGEVFVSLHNECDLDCAAYAQKNHVTAVFTSDTDFLIMPGDWPIWLPASVDLERYTVTAWNKKALRNALDLKQSQMPIYSVLSGNDWIPRERTMHIFEMFRGGNFQVRLAEFIRRHFPQGVPLSNENFMRLANIIYNDGKNSCTIQEAVNMVDTSLKFYSYIDYKVPETFPQWLKKAVEDTSSNLIYSLVKDLPIVVHQSFIDLSKRDVRPYCELALPIIRKQMGISDFHKNRENRERIVYLKPSHEEPYQAQKTTPIYPDFDVPPFNVLLGYDVTGEESAILENKRLEILAWIMSTKQHRVKPEIFKNSTNKMYIFSALTLNYLVKTFQITSEEADVMLLSIHETINASREKLESIEAPSKYEERSFWLGQVFLRLRRLYLDSCILCGLYEFRQYDAYDGFIFHKMYNKYQPLDICKRRTLIKPIEEYRIYATSMI